MPEPITIRIRQYQFALQRRYFAGTVLTEGEAQALDGLKAENVRNNVDQWVTAELGPSSTLLSPHQLEDLQRRIGEYDRNYQFSYRRRGVRQSAVVLEARQLALLAVAESRGLPVEEVEGDSGYREEIDQLSERPDIQQRARDNVVSKEAVAIRSLDEL